MGHASTLLYSLLYVTGVKAVDPDYERLGELSVTLDDSKRFRQLDSKCPGHAGPRASRPPRDPWARVWPPSVGMGKAVSRRRRT
jgi:hypothetical protein